MAFLAQLPARLQHPGTRKTGPWLGAHYYYVAFSVFFMSLCFAWLGWLCPAATDIRSSATVPSPRGYWTCKGRVSRHLLSQDSPPRQRLLSVLAGQEPSTKAARKRKIFTVVYHAVHNCQEKYGTCLIALKNFHSSTRRLLRRGQIQAPKAIRTYLDLCTTSPQRKEAIALADLRPPH
jgi:hypothetical protein